MNQEEEWSLVVAFPDQSHSFALGHEAGRLFAEMELGKSDCFVRQTNFENREVLIRQAHYLGWAIEIIPTETEGWDSVTFTKIKNYQPKPNPHGLRVLR